MQDQATAPLMVKRFTSRPIEVRAHRARAMRAPDTVGGGDVTDSCSRPTEQERLRDRIYLLETLIVILSVVAGIVVLLFDTL